MKWNCRLHGHPSVNSIASHGGQLQPTAGLAHAPDLTFNRQNYQGRDYWVVKDPISLKYYRFEEEEFSLLQLLDGKSSPDQIKRKFDFDFAPQKITLQELYQFIGMLYRSSLLISESPRQGVELLKRFEREPQAGASTVADKYPGDPLQRLRSGWIAGVFVAVSRVGFLLGQHLPLS